MAQIGDQQHAAGGFPHADDLPHHPEIVDDRLAFEHPVALPAVDHHLMDEGIRVDRQDLRHHLARIRLHRRPEQAAQPFVLLTHLA